MLVDKLPFKPGGREKVVKLETIDAKNVGDVNKILASSFLSFSMFRALEVKLRKQLMLKPRRC